MMEVVYLSYVLCFVVIGVVGVGKLISKYKRK